MPEKSLDAAIGKLCWLHLSDIHFWRKNDWRDDAARRKLITFLKNGFENGTLARPDLVFCTGDIAMGETAPNELALQYESAQGFFDLVLGVCGLPRTALFVVPGNHDVNRRVISRNAQKGLRQAALGEINKDWAGQTVEYKDAIKRLDEYGQFVKKYLPHQLDEQGRHCYTKVVNVNGARIGIGGFNSAWTCYDADDKGKLWLAGEWQFNAASHAFDDKTDLCIGLMHHPVSWFGLEEQSLAQKRIRAGFQFWLHGHEHDAWVVPTDREIVISAGAVNAHSDDEFGINLVRLDLAAGAGKVAMFAYKTAGNAWLICPSEDAPLAVRAIKFAKVAVMAVALNQTEPPVVLTGGGVGTVSQAPVAALAVAGTAPPPSMGEVAHGGGFDVFLSHSSTDKPVVRDIAERLRHDGLRVWFDEWEIEFGDSISSKVEEGLENSRVLVFFMSANAFGSDWAMLEQQTVRFRDPLNRNRRFIPVLLDDAPIKGTLAQFKYVDWRGQRDDAYRGLLKACARKEAEAVHAGQAASASVSETPAVILPITPQQEKGTIAIALLDNAAERIEQTRQVIFAWLRQDKLPTGLDLPFDDEGMPQLLADVFNAVTPDSTRASVADQCLGAISQLAKVCMEQLQKLPDTASPISADTKAALRAAFINAMQQAILLAAHEDKLKSVRLQAADHANSAQALDVNLWLSVSVLTRDELAEHVRADFPPGKLTVFQDKHHVNLFDEIELGTSEAAAAARKDLSTMAKTDRQGAETQVCKVVWNKLFPGEAAYSSTQFDILQGELRELADNKKHLLVIMEPQNGELSREFITWLNQQMHVRLIKISTKQGVFDISEGTWRAKLATLYKTLQPLEPTNRASA